MAFKITSGPVAPKQADEAQKTTVLEWQPTLHEKLIIYLMGLTSLIVALDASIIVTSLSTMIVDLKGDATQGFWIGTSYLLVNGVTMPFICSLSDVFGRPICFESAVAMFTIGVGGAGIHALGLVIMIDIVPLRQRPKWYGVNLGGWALGLTLGPVLGGAIVQHTTWRRVFYLMLPILGLALIAIPILLTLKPRTSTMAEKLARIDFLGGGLFTSSATSFLIGISWGGIQFDWDSAQTIVPIVIGAAGMVATMLYENHFASQPFLKKTLFKDTRMIVTYFNGTLQGLACYGWLYYLPLFFMSVKEFTPLNAGVAMLAVLMSITLAGIVSGRAVTRFNNYYWIIIIGWVFATLGGGLTLYWPKNNNTAVWVITQLIIGFGQGLVLNAQNFAVQAMSNPGEEGFAGAMYMFIRQFGFTLGVSIGGTTLQNVMGLKLRWEGLPADIAHHAEGYVTTLVALPDGALKTGIVDAYKYGLSGAYAVFIAVSAFALVLSVIFVKQCDMNKDLDTEHKLHTADMFRGDLNGRTDDNLPTRSDLFDGAEKTVTETSH